MKRKWIVLLAVMLSVFALSQGMADEGALEGIRKAGPISLGATGDYLPYSFKRPDGILVGADVEMAKDLAATLGVKAEFVLTSGKPWLSDLKAGNFDVAVGGDSHPGTGRGRRLSAFPRP